MPNRSRGKFDIVLDGGDLLMGFSLAREVDKPAVVPGELAPARLDEQVRNADLPRVVDNLDAGMGYSRRLERVPNGYAYAFPGYTRAPGGIFCQAGKLTEITLPAGWPRAAITCSERFRTPAGTFVYLGTEGPHILVLSDDGLTATIARTFTTPGWATGSMVVFNNRLYCGSGVGLGYLDGADGTWHEVSTVIKPYLAAQSWRPLGVPTEVIVGISQELNYNTIRWCPITADPMVDANWGAPVRVGAAGSSDARYQAKKLVAAPQHVYVLRPDGVYDMDELGARTFNIAPWIAEGVDHFNGGWGLHMGDGLYYAHAQGLAFVPTTGETIYRPEWADPGFGLPYEGPVRGLVAAGTLFSGWGLLGQWAPSLPESYVVAGRRMPSGTGSEATHVWHGAEAVVPGRITHMRVWTQGWALGQPRLLITTTDGGTPAPTVRAYWQSQPKSGTPIQELLWGGGFQPADAASLFLPADPYERPSAVKTMLQFELVTENMDLGSDLVKVYASSDTMPDWALQGTADAGTYAAFAPLELTEGRYIKTRIDLVGSPILRSADLRAALGIELREARTYRVVLGYDNGLGTPAGGRELRDPEQRLADLRTMLGRVVTLEAETPLRVRVLQVLAPERRQLGAANRAGAWAIVVPILVSILDHPFRYDGADHYDTDRTWG
jgi:hypothetical protein